jgi:hypothetical protein
VQCDEGSKLHREAVPDVVPAVVRLLCPSECHRWGYGRGEGSEPGDGQAEHEELETREGGGVPQDERLNADRRLQDEVGQGERVEARKVQPDERQLRRGANRHVAVQGELREGVLRRCGDRAGEKSAPEVAPAGVVRGDIVEHGQLEAPQCCIRTVWNGGDSRGENSDMCRSCKQRDVSLDGARTLKLPGGESTEERCLERTATPTVGTNPVIKHWVERQVDSLKPGKLVNARKQTNQFGNGVSSDRVGPPPRVQGDSHDIAYEMGEEDAPCSSSLPVLSAPESR